MCKCHPSKDNESWFGQKKYRLADFFDRWWDIYKKAPNHFITSEQYKAVNAIRLCRTEALGIDHYACPECGEMTKIYHSCKNRFCPTCSWQDTVKWAERIKNQMMDLPHRHVVMTLPHRLNNLIKSNGKELLDILLRTAADTFKDWMEHKYNLKPGIISVLHTFGETKEQHVHVHMIVSWGGITKTTKTLMQIKGEYVDYDFLKGKFRHKYEDQLIAMFDKGTLQHSFSNRNHFLHFIKRINKKKWIINLEPPMEIPTQVVRYIGRYSKRACLSEYKITKMEGEVIGFRYKDYKSKDGNNKPIERELELNYRDFFPRLLQHVPLPYFRLVRYYALYSNRANIPTEYQYSKDIESEKVNSENWETMQLEKTGENPLICPQCNKRKVYLYTTIKKRGENRTIIYKRIFFNKNKIPLEKVA